MVVVVVGAAVVEVVGAWVVEVVGPSVVEVVGSSVVEVVGSSVVVVGSSVVVVVSPGWQLVHEVPCTAAIASALTWQLAEAHLSMSAVPTPKPPVWQLVQSTPS